MRRPGRALTAVAGGVASLAVLASCGIPRDQAPRAVPAGQVDPRLLGHATPTGTPSPTGRAAYRVAFVTADDKLLLTRHPVAPGPPFDQVQQLLLALATGPDNTEHAHGLATALPSDATLTLSSLVDGHAVVAMNGGSKDTDARRLPLSVAQVVLTLTSHPAVDAVSITRDGSPVEPPLPGGTIVHRPLTAADYRSLLAGRAAPVPSATASP